MRFLHCADLHIGSMHDVETGIKSLAFLVEKAIQSQVDAMLIAGDLFDKTAPYPEAAHRAEEPLSRLSENGISVYAVEGNHDCRPDESLQLLEERGLICILRPAWDEAGKPMLQAGLAECCGVRIAGLGFLGNQTASKLRMFVDALPEDHAATVCMLHTGVYAGQVPIGGITVQDISYCAKKIQYIALGHRHGREEHGIAHNPGSPSGVRLNDPDADYGYYLADVGTGIASIRFFSTRNR